MQFEIQRCRELYHSANVGISMLPDRSAKCVRAAHTLYGRILDKIEAQDYDVFTGHGQACRPVRRRRWSPSFCSHDRPRRRADRYADRIAVTAELATVAGMIATPLLPQGGTARKVLSSVVVGGLFVSTTANAARRWGTARATATAAGIAVGDRRRRTDRHDHRGAVRPVRVHEGAATSDRGRPGDRAARVVRHGAARPRNGTRGARRRRRRRPRGQCSDRPR